MLSRTVYQRRRFVTSSFSSAREENLQEGTSSEMNAVMLDERADPDSRYLFRRSSSSRKRFRNRWVATASSSLGSGRARRKFTPKGRSVRDLTVWMFS